MSVIPLLQVRPPYWRLETPEVVMGLDESAKDILDVPNACRLCTGTPHARMLHRAAISHSSSLLIPALLGLQWGCGDLPRAGPNARGPICLDVPSLFSGAPV